MKQECYFITSVLMHSYLDSFVVFHELSFIHHIVLYRSLFSRSFTCNSHYLS